MLTRGGMPDWTFSGAGRQMRGAVIGPIGHEQWRAMIREIQPVRRADRGRPCYCTGRVGHVHV